MPIPTNKKELRTAITTNYQKLRLDLIAIPESITRRKELEGHAKNTKMSVCDLMAYLIGWGQLILKWHKKREAGRQVDFPETGYKWSELGKLAQKFYVDYESESFSKLLSKLDKTIEAILELIDKKTNKGLYEPGWYEDWPLGRLIQFNTSSPYDNARKRIRKFKRINNIKL